MDGRAASDPRICLRIDIGRSVGESAYGPDIRRPVSGQYTGYGISGMANAAAADV